MAKAKKEEKKEEKKKVDKVLSNSYCPEPGDVSELYFICSVIIRCRARWYGGLPMSREMVENWIKKGLKVEDEKFISRLKEEIDTIEQKELEEEIKKQIEQSWTGFKRNDKGIYLADYHIRAMLREASQRLDMFQKVHGTKQAIQHDIVVKPSQIVLAKDPHGYEEFCGHIGGKTPRDILKRCDYVEKVEVGFDVWILKHNVQKFTPLMLKKCFVFGQELGLLSNRSFMKGKFDLLKFMCGGKTV